MGRIDWKFYIEVTQMCYLENCFVITLIVKRRNGTHLERSVSFPLVAVGTEHRKRTLPVELEASGRDKALGLSPQRRHLRTPVKGVYQEMEKGMTDRNIQRFQELL